MKPTQEDLQLKSDDELDILCAEAQGWESSKQYNCSWMDGSSIAYYKDEYHPTQNTTEGKAQCWDLVVKYKLDFDEELGAYSVWTEKENGDLIVDYVEYKNPQRAVVMAAILSLQGE
jgi:hypothetical protein